MKQIKLTSILLALLLLLTGCQLARPDVGTVQSGDRLIGVLVTRDYLDLFDFAPDAHSPAEYGKYMIQQSGHYEFDENLDDFYDYEGYAQQRINDEDGMFTDRGYIAYKGYFSLEEIMEGGQGGSMEMGGMV